MTTQVDCNSYIFQKGFSAIVIVKNGDVESMIKFPDDMDKDEWKIVQKGIDHKLKTEAEIKQYRNDKKVRLGLDLMEKLHN